MVAAVSRRFTKLAAVKLTDSDAERARDSHASAIAELQGLVAAGLIILDPVDIPNGGQVIVSHRLGREPRMVLFSPPRVEFGTPGLVAGGILVDLPGNGLDRSQSLRILAAGYGCTVTVTIGVL